MILQVLKRAGLSLNVKKCHFFKHSVDYLGHVITPGKLAVATKNTEAITNASFPTTQSGVRRFLGMCNMYRRFVPNFSEVAAPLNKL